MRKITIVGAGRAGGAMAIALQRSGWAIENLVYHTQFPQQISERLGGDIVRPWLGLNKIASEILIIATADPEIAATAGRISEFEELPKTALHLSGSLDSGELSALAAKGVAVGSMHPLVSISDPVLGADRFSESFFCVEGAGGAVETAKELVGALGARSFSIFTESKPLYHASAVMASGHLTALIDTSIEMLAKCGLTATEAKSVLLPLISSTVENLKSQETSEALTGTFARGDEAAFARHLGSIDSANVDTARAIYLALGERSVGLLKRDNVENDGLARLEQAISIAKENSR